MLERPVSKAGWTRVAFGDVVRLSKARVSDPEDAGIERVVGLEHIEPGDLRIRRWGDAGGGTTFTTLFKPGQVLFGKRRAYQRKVAVADFEGVCSGDIYVLEPANDRLMPELLPFLCQTDAFFDHAVGTSAGSLSPRTNWTSLAGFEFLLPPIQEQSRLVEVYTASNSAIESLLDAGIELDKLEMSLLLAKFGAKYGKNPDGYDLLPLAQLAEIRTGLAKGKPCSSETIDLPYLSVANVKDGSLDLSAVKDITVESNRVQRYSLQAGDVLMTEGGDLDKLGRGTVWQAEIPVCLHQNHVFAVRTDRSLLDPWFLAALARSVYGKSYFRKCAKRSSNLASINKAQVSAFLVPAAPIVEQRKWLETYQEIRRQGGQLSERIEKLRAVTKRIVEVGFTNVI
ncbi:hypothetical protein [Rhizobium leguminosarum]|uniref:restriction endonuclease subunit S n=1 Tax=Rhizobium leguminosarum TaxID=384 RepID=UPI001C9481A5|nr:hypothetical protein [Rhizobium leguminosarum]MBY5367833.1 restriction endonuclease subunit S [Rhizobium leguminosarum]